MPMATPELFAEFEDDDEALKVVKDAGYKEAHNGVLRPPHRGFTPCNRVASALDYLVDEWDYEVTDS